MFIYFIFILLVVKQTDTGTPMCVSWMYTSFPLPFVIFQIWTNIYILLCVHANVCVSYYFFIFFFQSKSANVLAVLGAVASEALDLTGFYYSGKPSVVKRRLNQISRTSTGRHVILCLSFVFVLEILLMIIDMEYISFWLQNHFLLGPDWFLKTKT